MSYFSVRRLENVQALIPIITMHLSEGSYNPMTSKHVCVRSTHETVVTWKVVSIQTRVNNRPRQSSSCVLSTILCVLHTITLLLYRCGVVL